MADPQAEENATTVSTDHEATVAAIAPEIAEIAATLKAGSLTTVKLSGTDESTNLTRQLVATLQNDSVDPTLLQEIRISTIHVGPAGMNGLAPVLHNATAITAVVLRSTAIGDSGAVTLASALQSAPNLTYLVLSSNGIGDAGAIAIATSMQCWPGLLTLSMSANEIGTAGAAALGEAMSTHPTIDLLSLRFNPLKDAGLQALCSKMRQNSSLATVLLEDCQFTTVEVGFLKEVATTSLAQLYVGKNDIGEEGARAIAAALHSNTVLTLVALDRCGLGPSGAARLAEELEVNTSLTMLALDSNAIMDEGAIALAGCLRQNTSLISINLSENLIGDTGATAIASALARNAILRELTLTKNQIGSVGCTALCDNLQERHCRLQLLLEDNPISQDDRRRLRDAFNESSIFVDVTDTVADLDDSTLATTITAAISGTRDNTVSSISIRGDSFTLQTWDALMQALVVNTSVQSLALLQVSGLSRFQLKGLGNNNTYGKLADVLNRNTTLKCVSLQRSLSSAPAYYLTGNFEAFLECMSSNSTLERLILNNCLISSSGTICLAESIQTNPTSMLRVLEMMNNAEIDDDGAVALASMLRTNNSIEEIALCDNSIGDVGAIALGSALEINQKVSVFRIRNNDIGSAGATAIAKALTVNRSIKVLQLNANRVGDLGAAALGNALQKSTTLVELTLGSNDIGDQGCKDFASALRPTLSLRTLVLAENSITSSGASALFTALPTSDSTLERLNLAGNPIETIGVEFLNTQPIHSVTLNYANIAWPPPSVSSRATHDDRSAFYGFLKSVAASSTLLVRSRLMLVGHGGAGKTTLKTALLMSSDSSAITRLRESILEIIRTKWMEADIQCWVDADLSGKPGFFKDSCPGASGITGARWLEYSQSELVTVFGASETETARRVVRKMAEVLCFLQPHRPEPSADDRLQPITGWEWISDVVSKALEDSAPHFGDFVGMDNPQTFDVSGSTSRHIRYDALLNLPHVWTEGIELEFWDEAEYTLWDLPGQMELYPSHRMFSASVTAVYVLVINGGTGYDACIAKLSRWLSSLRSGFRHSGNGIKVPVRIVLSHTDTLTTLERASLMREVLEVAVQRFSDDFDFGPTCFATLYGEEGGGEASTGVDALRTELIRLRSIGVDRHALPTSYQRACDDIVTLARTDEMSRWPIIEVDRLPHLLTRSNAPIDDAMGCLEDLGFVHKARNRLILEPVTWLSRLMAAFLHPFHGVATVIAESGEATTLQAHIAAATITSVAASRVVNQRGRIVQAENEGEVLEMLSNFDVCFELGKDGFVFPILLGPVTTKAPWLDKGFRTQLGESTCVARRYHCVDDCDAIPPTLSALLMEAVVCMDDCQPVFLGRCTAIVYLTDHKCYIGLYQAIDDSTLDLFAVGGEQQRFLGLVTLNIALLLAEHYPRLRMKQRLLWTVGTHNKHSLDHATEEVDHILLGPCFTEHSTEPVTNAQLEVAARDVPTWFWESLGAIVLRTVGAVNAVAVEADPNDSLAVLAWKKSAIRQIVLHHCPPLCTWIETHYPDNVSKGSDGVSAMCLRGERLLVDVLGARTSSESQASLFDAEKPAAQGCRSSIGDIPPHMCGITFEVLKAVYEQAAALAGDDFPTWSMRDVNRAIVKPLCAQHGTSLALVHSPDGLEAEVFVSHAWGEAFKHFAECIMDTYRTSVRKPTLWICTFALMQSDDPAMVAQQIGAVDAPLTDAPFSRAIQHAREILVVRNDMVDVYSRLWCVCEVYFAHMYGLAPNHTKVVGSDAFAGVMTSCLDAKCRDRGDRVRILHALIGGSAANAELVERIDGIISEFRRFTGDVDVSIQGPI